MTSRGRSQLGYLTIQRYSKRHFIRTQSERSTLRKISRSLRSPLHYPVSHHIAVRRQKSMRSKLAYSCTNESVVCCTLYAAATSHRHGCSSDIHTSARARVCVSLLLVRAEQSSGHQSFAHHVGLTRLWKTAERVWDSHPLNLPKPNESGKWGGMRTALTSQLPAPPRYRRQIGAECLL